MNLTAIVHECSTPYLMINLEYTAAAVPGYTVPTEEFSMLHPMVLVTAKRVSGNSQDVSQNVENNEVYIRNNIGVEPEGFDNTLTSHVGKTCGNGHYTF